MAAAVGVLCTFPGLFIGSVFEVFIRQLYAPEILAGQAAALWDLLEMPESKHTRVRVKLLIVLWHFNRLNHSHKLAKYIFAYLVSYQG